MRAKLMEGLERRQHLTTTVNVVGTVLTIVNDDDSHAVVVSRPTSNWIVKEDGITIATIGTTGITEVLMYGYGGDDRLEVAGSPIGGLPGITLYGGAGNDTIIGSIYNDHIEGGDGNDLVNPRNGGDTVLGDEGNDTFIFSNGNDDFSGGAGVDTWDASGITNLATVKVSLDDLANDDYNGWAQNVRSDVEVLIGSKNGDTLTGSAANETLVGGLGNDSLTGGAGDDLIQGGGGNDKMYGGDGNDTLDGTDGGNDSVFGDAGDDLFTGFYDLARDTLNGGDGIDTLDANDALELITDIEVL